MTTVLTEELVRRIDETVRAMDRWIEEARRLVGQGKHDEAGEAVAEAIRHKRILLALIPSIWVLWNDNDAELPFEPVYDTLAGMDRLAELLEMLVLSGDDAVTWFVPEPDLDDVIARLRVALQELQTNLADRPWSDDDGAAGLIDGLKAALERLIAAAKAYDEDLTEPPGRLYKDLVSAKKALLEEFSVDVKLWDAYTQLAHIDALLEKAASNLGNRLDAITDRHILEWLREAEATKHKFALLVADSWRQRQAEDEPPEPEQPAPDPPEPHYPPGLEDLPPFPPEGPPWHAQRSFEHSHLLGLITVSVRIVNDAGACAEVQSSLKLPLLPPLSIARSRRVLVSGKNLRWTLGERVCR